MKRRSHDDVGASPPHTKTSTHVTAASLRALTSAGFSPLGVVFGNASVHLALPVTLGTRSRLTSFGRGWSGDNPELVPAAIRTAQGDTSGFVATFPCPHGQGRVVRRTSGHYTGFNFEVPGPGLSLGQAFHGAVVRLVESATDRGAHGVIDVSVRLDGDPMLHGMVALTLTGTAVAHKNAPAPKQLFTATLGAQALVKLLGEGLFPTAISFGAVLLDAWTGCGARAQLDSGFSTQVDQLGALLTQGRDHATTRMTAGCTGADVVLDTHLTHAFHESTKSDYRVAAWASGTGARRFADPDPGAPALPVLTMEQR